MNEKANITKDLNAKHAKILEGLVRLPENKECADCSNKAPRWASVNIGAFICMQCSGIHRSLGVHISKVRSTTLDTWLPEQVAFMQRVGNRNSNSYWEAELPPDYNRKPIESFIRAKYVDKTWVDKNGVQPCPELYETPNRMSDAGLIEHHPPRKERRLSLEEEILTKHVSQALGPPRNRGCSLDLKDPKAAPNPNGGRPPLGDNLLNAPNSKQECCTTTPSNWQTFECKFPEHLLMCSIKCSIKQINMYHFHQYVFLLY